MNDKTIYGIKDLVFPNPVQGADFLIRHVSKYVCVISDVRVMTQPST